MPVRDHVDIARHVAEQITLGAALLVELQPYDCHLESVERMLADRARGDGTSFMLTGKPRPIQRLRLALGALGVASARIMTKAYRAAGKAGHD